MKTRTGPRNTNTAPDPQIAAAETAIARQEEMIRATRVRVQAEYTLREVRADVAISNALQHEGPADLGALEQVHKDHAANLRVLAAAEINLGKAQRAVSEIELQIAEEQVAEMQRQVDRAKGDLG